MSHKFIEVVSDYPTTEKDYSLLLNIDQIVQVRAEIETENEPAHDPVAIVTLTTGETLVLRNSYRSLVEQLNKVHMILRP